MAAALELPFVTLDVFTTERYRGNPLAVVTVPRGTSPALTQAQKQRIAREFNLSETVIVHEGSADDADPTSRTIDIFLTQAEIPFAGHPTIGAAVSLLDQGVTTLVTKAGPVALSIPSPRLVRAAIPHNTRLHSRRLDRLPSHHGHHLSPHPDLRAAETGAPIFSIVNGMSSLLVELPSLDLRAAVARPTADLPVPDLLDDGWQAGRISRYYYVHLGTAQPQDPDDAAESVVRLRTRSLVCSLEDPATGSAACALSSYLTLFAPGAPKHDRTVRYEVTQGVEMGRDSTILVDITTRDAAIHSVSLAGTATQVMRGYVSV